MLNGILTKRLFSTFKVPIEHLKKLREQTSAPMGECKKALEESQGNYEVAIKWLKEKGLMSATKRQNRETREGVVSGFVSPCRKRLIMLEANCETDFVAKNDMFLRFVNNLSQRILDKDELVGIESSSEEENKQAIESLLKNQPSVNTFPEEKDISNAYEELRVLISRLQENIRIRRVITLHSDHGRFGVYVHQEYTNGVGIQVCAVESVSDPEIDGESQEEIDTIGQFTDNMATQILGTPPKYLKAEQIPMEILEEETDKVREEMAAALQKAPEHMHERIISGKLKSNFYEHCFLPSMNYILSNDGVSVGQYWEEVEKELGKQIMIESSKIWQCK